jgi:nucleoside-diphosphate-sugar epimerase
LTSIVVTGGSGKAGQAAIKELVDHGHAVMNVDMVPPKTPLCHFFKADLTDLGQAVDALKRAAGTVDRRRTPLGQATAVVHLAGIPAPSLAPDGATFDNNLMSTYNVFSAATWAGLDRVVWASSETVYGLPLTRTPPVFAPITEDHPLVPETGYALAKVLCEQMAREMHRWNPGTRFVGLRISNVFDETDYAGFATFSDRPETRQWNLWSWVDVRDVAQACRLGVEADVPGCDVFNIVAADTVMRQPTRELMTSAFPSIPLHREVSGHETLQSIAKARRVLGYAPTYSWRPESGS